MNIHEKIYVPEYSIQGEKIPMFITWDKSKLITIKISLPKSIEITDIYNLDENGYCVNGNTIIFNKFESNGYLGLVLSSNSEKIPNINEVITITLVNDDDEKIINKEIELFRADVNVVEKPHCINILYDGEKLNIEGSIVVENKGKGTGIIKLEEQESSDLIKTDPTFSESFVANFWRDFLQRLKKQKEKYPQHSELIDEFCEIMGKELSFEKEKMPAFKDTMERLTRTFEDDKNFLEDFFKIIFISCISNYSVINHIESFIEYIKSINIGRIILSNPIKVINVSPCEKILRAKLTITDLAYNSYESIELGDIRIKSNEDCEVPIYLLFKFIKNGRIEE